MIELPKLVTRGPVWALAVYSAGFALVTLPGRPAPLTDAAALALFLAAFALMVVVRPRPRVLVEVAVVATAAAVPVLSTWGLDPATGSYTTAGWYISAVGCLGVGLLILKRARSTWLVFAILVVHTVLWAGPVGLVGYGVLAVLLLVAVGAVAAEAVARTEAELTRFHLAEREIAEWRAAQDAFHLERQVRLERIGRIGVGMLERVVAHGGRLPNEDRRECRVLEQTVRDEIRGRRLLNDPVRAQVLAARRRGAVVQVLDDGGLDDVGGAELDRLLDRVAEALEPLRSTRIVLRTGAKDSGVAITVVATTVDLTAAALGLDDDEEVDLWLELARPVPAER